MKIEDFGQLLLGAAKHRYLDWRQKLTLIPDHMIDRVALNVAFPAPNYARLIAKGISAETVATIRALRDTLGFTHSGHRRQIEPTEVVLHRNCAAGLIDMTMSVQEVLDQLAASKLRITRATLELIIDYHLASGHSRSYWQKDARISDKKISPGRKFRIYRDQRTNKIAICARVGRTIVSLMEFKTLRDAKAAKEAQIEVLQRLLEEHRKIPALRNEQNRDRFGPDWRAAAEDISPEKFAVALPFRGVQFGNHVENARRQQDLNDAFDACHDLAAVLGISPSALTLDGTLGLAFGARGHGGKYGGIAHYELRGAIINITKPRGAGSFAHEWWHALDHHIARSAGLPHLLASKIVGTRKFPAADLGPLRDELDQLLRAIRGTGLFRRSGRLDRRRSEPYFSTFEEITARSFEAWVLHRLQSNGQTSDWLVNLLDWNAWRAASEEEQGNEYSSFPYPLPEEMPVISAGFEHLFRHGGPMHAYLVGLTDIDRAEAA